MPRDEISFNQFCEIINDRGGCANERKGMRSVYDSKKESQGFVTREDAILVARAIVAQNVDFEW